MVIRILEPSPTFSGLDYNNNKVESGAAELMKAANFGYLDGLTNVRQQDYHNYLLAIAAQNSRIKNIQYHAAISTEGQNHSKEELTEIAERLLEKMSYGDNPYLIFSHNDTPNNHVHMVTSRVDKQGHKIRDSFEHVRSVAAMKQVMKEWLEDKIAPVLAYRFTTAAQLKQLLERHGFDPEIILKDLPADQIKYREPARERRQELKDLFRKYPSAEILKEKFNIDLVFHAKDGLPAYGYTVFDDSGKNVFKGGQIMPLKEFLALSQVTAQSSADVIERRSDSAIKPYRSQERSVAKAQESKLVIPNISISKDIDDEAVHGRRRHRGKKARTNRR